MSSLLSLAERRERLRAWAAGDVDARLFAHGSDGIEQLENTFVNSSSILRNDIRVIANDAPRTLLSFPAHVSPATRRELQDRVRLLLLKFFIAHADARYYQGFSAVAGTALLALGDDDSLRLLAFLAQQHLRPLLYGTFDILTELSAMVHALVQVNDPVLADRIGRIEIMSQFFISWLFTLFSHEASTLADARAYLFFVVDRCPLSPVYASAAMILHHGAQITRLLDEGAEEGEVMVFVKRLPHQGHVQTVLSIADELIARHHPSTLRFLGRDHLFRKFNVLIPITARADVRRAALFIVIISLMIAIALRFIPKRQLFFATS